MRKRSYVIIALLLVFSLLLLNACSAKATVINTPAGDFSVSSFTLGVDYGTKTPSSGNQYLSVMLIPTNGSSDMDKALAYFVTDNATSINANGAQGSLQFISFESAKNDESQVNTILVFEVPENTESTLKPAVITVGETTYNIDE